MKIYIEASLKRSDLVLNTMNIQKEEKEKKKELSSVQKNKL